MNYIYIYLLYVLRLGCYSGDYIRLANGDRSAYVILYPPPAWEQSAETPASSSSLGPPSPPALGELWMAPAIMQMLVSGAKHQHYE